jgi:hypothetical protein
VPIWVSEWAVETRPQVPYGVSYAQQARDATAALKLAASNPDVDMFVWLVLRDSGPSQWSSGLENRSGKRKPAYAAFARTAAASPSMLRPARVP